MRLRRLNLRTLAPFRAPVLRHLAVAPVEIERAQRRDVCIASQGHIRNAHQQLAPCTGRKLLPEAHRIAGRLDLHVCLESQA